MCGCLSDNRLVRMDMGEAMGAAMISPPAKRDSLPENRHEEAPSHSEKKKQATANEARHQVDELDREELAPRVSEQRQHAVTVLDDGTSSENAQWNRSMVL